ncbi:MAG: glycerol-3-phosphate 1-O-acyltransferase PlsY [Hyphomicrobiales bacterium]
MIDPISWSHALPYLLTALAAGYLFGSVPFGLLITKLSGLGDVREIGSGNIGATNVLRTGRKGIAAATLVADILKGALPVLLAGFYGPDISVCAALGAVIGHVWPVWLRFKGGKGVATLIGVQLGLYWPVGVIFLAVWLGVALAFRYSSLSSLTATALSPVWAAWFDQWQFAELFVMLAVIIFFSHRANIVRLLKREESRIKLKG